MSLLTCFTELNGIMLDVADLTYSCLTVKTDNSYLARGKSYKRYAVFLRNELRRSTCGTNELSALTGIKLDIVNDSTNGNSGDGECRTESR